VPNVPGVPGVPGVPAKPAPSTPAVTVVIDPAHGGSDAGARGAAGVLESDVVLNFARVLRLALEAQGIRVLLTREGNQDPSFDDRSALINGLRGAIFISLHVASTGPVGTVRAYWYGGVTGDLADAPATTGARAAAGRPAVAARGGLVFWNHAQESHRDASRRLADLTQIQLAQKFRGSPEVPEPAPVRQLRSIAGPAIAVEVSSVAVSDPGQLQQMARPLADSVTRAVTDFAAIAPTAGAAPAGAAPGGIN
jgi:N-acetylmuramoyl-L-alanine amidase